jgi:hypothetical protein
MRLLATAATTLLLAVPAAAPAAEPGDDAAKGYVIETAGTTTPLAKGAAGRVVLTIRAQGSWHVDPRTPLRIDLAAPDALRLEKTTLRKKDAANPGDESPRFEAPFTALAAGSHEVRAKVDFFVCSSDACVKQVRDVVIPVSVK